MPFVSRSRNIIVLTVALLLSSLIMESQTRRTSALPIVGATSADTLLNRDTTLQDTSAVKDTLLLPKKRSPLEEPVAYQAQDSIVFFGNGFAHLYGQGTVDYQNIALASDYIRMSMDSSSVFAAGRPDSTGEMVGEPVFKEGETEYVSKTMRYNFRTKKGFITNVVTKQGEGYLTSAKTKKMADDQLSVQSGKYTTCDNHEHPHFYLQLTKAKLKQGSHIVAGPAYLVMEDVPLPLFLPFGYFPFTKTYSSGIIMPTFGDEMQRGFFLRNGGYYFAINDYVDAALTGEIYTKGSWGLNLQSNYVWKYHFSGSLQLSFINSVISEKGLPDYRTSRDFRVNWSHTQDAKSNPYLTFSASVNFSTSSYDRNDVNSFYDPNLVSQNTKSSTVNLTYRVPESPFSLSVRASVEQRTADSTLSLNLPELTLSLSRIYPFKRKNPIGKERWYEKISFDYTGMLKNNTLNKESKVFSLPYLQGWKLGMQHSAKLGASFNLFKYISISPSINYTERWYTTAEHKGWDYMKNREVVKDTTYGFYRVYNFSAGLSMQTQLYGFYKSLPFLGDWTVRHRFIPSVGISGQPDFGLPFWGFYDSYTYVDQNQNTRTVSYSPFQNGMFGTVSKGAQANVNMSISNNIELKYLSNTDSVPTYKKLSLIDDLSFSTSYNMIADSLRWSDISGNIRIKLIKDFSLNLSMSFDPYTYGLNQYGSVVKLNTSQASKYGRLFVLKSASTSFSYTFSNETFKKKSSTDSGESSANVSSSVTSTEENTNEEGLPSSSSDLRKKKEKIATDDFGYLPFSIPWSLTLNYSLSFGYKEFNKETMEYNRGFQQNLGISGSIKFTKNWSFNFSTNYNIDRNELAQLNLSIMRDLHCWQMSASVVPIGPYASYTFNIAVKSSLLKDIKYDQRSDRVQAVRWE